MMTFFQEAIFRRGFLAITNFPLLCLLTVGLVPRLYNLGAPVIGVHSWRQADTAAIARNFYEMQLQHPSLLDLWRLAYPQVDWGGGGYAETEFPLYPALVSFIYRLLGPHEIYARGLSVVFSLVGLYFLYRLIELCFDASVAFWSALFYAILPLSVFYGRTVQPESLVMMSGLGGLYFFCRWLGLDPAQATVGGGFGFGSAKPAGTRRVGFSSPRARGLGFGFSRPAWLRGFSFGFARSEGGDGFGVGSAQPWGRDLLISWIFVAIAVLLKVLPLVYLGLPLLFLAVLKFRAQIFLRLDLWLYALGILAVTAAWYLHAHNLFLQTGLTFGFWSGDTDRYSWASLISPKYWMDILFRVMVRHFAVVSFLIALVGLTLPRQKTADWMWEVGLVGSFLAGALAPTSSYVHEYYQLPVMMFGVVFIGKVFDRVLNRTDRLQIRAQSGRLVQKRWYRPAIAIALALTLLTGSVIYTIDYMWRENPNKSEVYALAQQIKQNTPPEAKILATTGGDPTLLYLAHRHGWMISPEEVSAERLSTAAKEGADYFVGSYEIVQNYTDFVDESQKENIRKLLKRYAPVVNDDRNFIARITP